MNPSIKPLYYRFILISLLLLTFLISGCGPSKAEIESVDYTPLSVEGWQVSTPADQGLDPEIVAKLYLNAEESDSLYGLLVIKNGNLVAEKYYRDGSVDQISARHSATKSYTSALVGLALEEGCLSSIDLKMMDFFPEYTEDIVDPRKEQITIRQMLQMRAGYPYDSTDEFGDILYLSGNWRWIPHLVDFPLVTDPGTKTNYSSMTSHLLGVIVSRSCDTDLESFAREHLFSPMNAELGSWTRDPYGYNWGWGEIYVTARDMGKFGLVYLNDGEFEGRQIIPSSWVKASLQSYSDDPWVSNKIGRYFTDIGYGYQWWSAAVGNHDFDFVWGHGGQLVVLLEDLDMVIVTTADPLHHLAPADGWKYEKQIFDIVGAFIKSLPTD